MKNSSPIPGLAFCARSPRTSVFSPAIKKGGESSPQLVSRSLHRQ
ncbi:hypothetical protein HMPREF3213_03177 [Heyndrickxia coagulans]|uniref:Uncharacterized protein n=1 Tax=Heyndrickxia coagulans TaxID=1398 RepID=A0A133KE63_HEYCO|nr:hypothetical protein HMPREF3213_03177 [Heyndrickxia coagulans]